ncbi:hypothetical protein B0H14DRAFT_3860032 [Mycena olivaceomarginata]|nr:hypothetical protein B0H14DRAFT_3860032 [Mycena olivaceomarginata]
MSTTENTGHHTRGATAAGIFEAPPPIYGPSEASPISDSVSVAEDGHNVSYPLATVPSTVVTGGPVLVERGSPGVSPSERKALPVSFRKRTSAVPDGIRF